MQHYRFALFELGEEIIPSREAGVGRLTAAVLEWARIHFLGCEPPARAMAAGAQSSIKPWRPMPFRGGIAIHESDDATPPALVTKLNSLVPGGPRHREARRAAGAYGAGVHGDGYAGQGDDGRAGTGVPGRR